MNFVKFCQDFNIPYQTGGKNVSYGWVGICCPFCSDTSFHLGFKLRGNYFHCWICDWKPIKKVVSKLLAISEEEAKRLVIRYGGDSHIDEDEEVIAKKPYQFPSGTAKMKQQHRKYLESRKFDPDKLEYEWNLLGTDFLSTLDSGDYKHRILAPIMWKSKEVTFQTRDITGKAESKYKACPKQREIIHHKDILYGDQTKWGDVGICVEGIADVWRFGPLSFAVFGTAFKQSQIWAIAGNFKKVVIVFDNEEKAQLQAEQLAYELELRGVKTWIQTVEDDPGEMSQDDADHFVYEITH